MRERCHPQALWRDPRTRWCGLAALAVLLISCETIDRRIEQRALAVSGSRALVVEGHTARASVAGQHGLFHIDGDNRLEPADVQRVTITNQHSVPVFVRLTRPGWPDLTSAETILEGIHDVGMTDEEKALAIYEFVKAWRIHWFPPYSSKEMHDPVKLIGVYGYGYCDDSARAIEQLATRAGLRARVWELHGHVVSEIYFDGRWHLLDADKERTYDHPNGYLAGVEDLAADPSLDPEYGYLYSSTHDNVVSPAGELSAHSLALKLAPGDSATFAKKQVEYLPRSLQERLAPHEEYADAQGPRTWTVGRFVAALGAGQHYVEVPYALLGGRLRADACCVQGRLGFGEPFVHAAHDLPVDGSGETSDFGQLIAARPEPPYMVWLDVNVPTELELTFQFAPQSIPWLEGSERQFEVFVAPAPPGTLDAMSGLVEVVYEMEQMNQVARFNLGHLDGRAHDGWMVESPDG